MKGDIDTGIQSENVTRTPEDLSFLNDNVDIGEFSYFNENLVLSSNLSNDHLSTAFGMKLKICPLNAFE